VGLFQQGFRPHQTHERGRP